jgi:hypothetical protein
MSASARKNVTFPVAGNALNDWATCPVSDYLPSMEPAVHASVVALACHSFLTRRIVALPSGLDFLNSLNFARFRI